MKRKKNEKKKKKRTDNNTLFPPPFGHWSLQGGGFWVDHEQYLIHIARHRIWGADIPHMWVT
ncbi:hypothetical protein E2C01_101213 [Portunus trituberculatus]|uniref:Uncharacterized protein n=1 Tax=Portunus trituberculatus TaxID=210409 RepID=A0A5B7KFJ8_PORTR|nr:hypothetical protein [Portunus trituberculatus]